MAERRCGGCGCPLPKWARVGVDNCLADPCWERYRQGLRELNETGRLLWAELDAFVARRERARTDERLRRLWGRD